MSLFQDYDEIQETVKGFEKSKDFIEIKEGNEENFLYTQYPSYN